jgi:aquaporin Z
MLAFAYISGGQFNPAITLGSFVAGKIRAAHAAAYIGAQLIGAAAGALTLFGILRTVPNIPDTRAAFDTVTAGFGEHSVIQTPMAGVLLAEVLGAALLVAVFLGTTARRNVHAAAAPFAVGLAFAVLLQFGQAIGNAPFNPARATASALFSNSWSLEQLWLFWVAPLVGAAIAGLVFRGFSDSSAAAGTAVAHPVIDEGDTADALDAGDDFDGEFDGGVSATEGGAPAAAGAAPVPAGPRPQYPAQRQARPDRRLPETVPLGRGTKPATFSTARAASSAGSKQHILLTAGTDHRPGVSPDAPGRCGNTVSACG